MEMYEEVYEDIEPAEPSKYRESILESLKELRKQYDVSYFFDVVQNTIICMRNEELDSYMDENDPKSEQLFLAIGLINHAANFIASGQYHEKKGVLSKEGATLLKLLKDELQFMLSMGAVTDSWAENYLSHIEADIGQNGPNAS